MVCTTPIELASMPIIKNAIKKAVNAVTLACEKAHVSPTGFNIDINYCDWGAVSTEHVVDVIDIAAGQFGDSSSSHGYITVATFICEAVTDLFRKKSLYPDMDEAAESLAYEYFELENDDDIDHNTVNSVNEMLAKSASNLTHNLEIAGAIALLKKTHPSAAERLEGLCDASLIRDYILDNA